MPHETDSRPLLVGTRTLRRLFLLVSFLLAAGIVSGKSAFLAAAAPLMVRLFLSLWDVAPPRCTIATHSTASLRTEGEKTAIALRIAATDQLPLLRVLHTFQNPVRKKGAVLSTLSLREGDVLEKTFFLEMPGRGVYLQGSVTATALAGSCGFIASWRSGTATPCRVLPRLWEMGRTPLAIPGGRHHSGIHISRFQGDGLEFAEVREFREGEPLRNINWRTTATQGHPFVNERLLERCNDIVLVVDTLKDAGNFPDSCLDRCTRAAGTIALSVLRKRDRVGLIEYGGILEWLPPRSGLLHMRRLLDRLAEARVSESFGYRDPATISPLGLPAGALVLVLSPLLDDRSFQMLSGLVGRGFDPVVLYVSPFSAVEHRNGSGRTEKDALSDERTFQEERLQVLRGQGLRFAEWNGSAPLEVCLERAFSGPGTRGKRLRTLSPGRAS